MSTEENKALARRYIEEVWNRGNLAFLDQACAPDYVFHDPPNPDLHGPGKLKPFVGALRAAFPDATTTIQDLLGEGERVVWRWSYRGTHTGPLLDIPATGKQVTVTGIVISRFAGGKVVEDWVNRDTLGLLQQLGVIPGPAQAT